MNGQQSQPLVDEVEETDHTQLPAISIVVLNHNGRTDLPACLASLVELNYPSHQLETIIVDNASTDDSVPWLRRCYPNVRLMVNPANLGFAGGINCGAGVASGSYLAFINPDMRADRDWLLALSHTLRTQPDVACAGSVVLNWSGDRIDYAGRFRDSFNLCPHEGENAAEILHAEDNVPLLFASGGAMLISREVFLSLEGFDQDYFLYHEDTDLGWRLWLHGFRALRSTRSLVYHKGGASSKTLSPQRVWAWAQKYILYTMLKDMDDDQLWVELPRVLWFLSYRSRWYPGASSGLGQAIDQLLGEMETIWRKRAAVQAARVRRDAEIFAACGHPFEFLQDYGDCSSFEQCLQANLPSMRPAVSDARTVSEHIVRLLYHVYKFNYDQAVTPAPTAARPSQVTQTSVESSQGDAPGAAPPCSNAATITPTSQRVASMVRFGYRVLPTPWLRRIAPFWRLIRRVLERVI